MKLNIAANIILMHGILSSFLPLWVTPPNAGTVIDMLTPETTVNLSALSPAAAPVVEATENRTSAYVTGTTPPHASA